MVKFQFNFIICSTTITVLIIAFFTGFVKASKKYKYESSYAFMDLQNNEQICVNFQQWRSRDLPSSAAKSLPRMMKWWIPPNVTNICKARSAGIFMENDIIPAEYLTRMAELDECISRIGFNQTDSRAVRNQVAIMKKQGVRNILFIVQKGKVNGYGLHDLLASLKPNHLSEMLSIIKNKTKTIKFKGVKHDYLFTHFYNSEIDDLDESMNIFYIYEHIFKEKIQPIIGQQQFRIYQPQSSMPMDPAVVVIWLFAFSSILIGSLWAAADTRGKIAVRLMKEGSQTELTQEEGESSTTETTTAAIGTNQSENIPPRIKDNKNGGMKRTESAEIAQMSGWQYCCSVGFALFIVVSVLMLAFFFRDYAVSVFNIITVILGTFSIHCCLYALLQLVIGREFDFKIGTFRQLFCGKCRQNGQNENQLEEREQQTERNVSSSRLDQPILLLSSILFIISASICIFWFTIRNNAYSFLLLDSINLTICIFTIRGSRIRSLRLITFLLLAMFGYDLFMVFGTRLLTADGCSVMLQVVTGMDCRSTSTTNSSKQYQPMAPIDAVLPQKIPLVFYAPILADPMAKCYDLEVEREYKYVLLGLGDVILPGYLIAFCFYMDVVEKNRFHTYGLISMIGYSLGMACTFIALLIMETGQPALIYLVPFTLIPVCLWAFFGDEKGTLAKMWRGEL